MSCSGRRPRANARRARPALETGAPAASSRADVVHWGTDECCRRPLAARFRRPLRAMPKAAFVFPAASGHTNPSLPLARALVVRGWDVDYLHSPQFQEAIEDTGATFVDRDLAFKESAAPSGGSVPLSVFKAPPCAARSSASTTTPQWSRRRSPSTAPRLPGRSTLEASPRSGSCRRTSAGCNLAVQTSSSTAQCCRRLRKPELNKRRLHAESWVRPVGRSLCQRQACHPRRLSPDGRRAGILRRRHRLDARSAILGCADRCY